LDGILNRYEKRISEFPAKQVIQTSYTRGMTASDRRHLDNLASQQLDAVILSENSCLAHLVELGDREQPSRRLNGH